MWETDISLFMLVWKQTLWLQAHFLFGKALTNVDLDDLSVPHYSLADLYIKKTGTLSNTAEAFATLKTTFNKNCMINCWNTNVNIFYVCQASYLKVCLCCFLCKRIEWFRVNEGFAHLPCPGSTIFLCLEHTGSLWVAYPHLPEKSRYLLLLVRGKTDAHRNLQTSENSACVFVKPIVK